MQVHELCLRSPSQLWRDSKPAKSAVIYESFWGYSASIVAIWVSQNPNKPTVPLTITVPTSCCVNRRHKVTTGCKYFHALHSLFIRDGELLILWKSCPLNSTSCFCPDPLTGPVVLLNIKKLGQPTDCNPLIPTFTSAGYCSPQNL